MSLAGFVIESFGGYEKAKAKFRDNQSLHAERLKSALLKYRREHNIFEVGDWVFPVVRIIDEIEGIGRYICTEKGELVVVRDVKNKGAYCSHEHRLDNSFYMKFSEFRHANDAEIKAGKRLEVNQ